MFLDGTVVDSIKDCNDRSFILETREVKDMELIRNLSIDSFNHCDWRRSSKLRWNDIYQKKEKLKNIIC